MANTPKNEQPSTYFVSDRSSEEELMRLQIQDRMLTANMGGVLPEQPDPASFERVLDVGCGTGGWLIEAAETYPGMKHLVGVDVSQRMIEYARAQAQSHHVEDRVEFRVMDALRMLEFPADSFDLVNQRLGVSYLRTWDWPKLLSEYQRVARRGAVIRVTESDICHANTPAFTQLSELFLQVMAKAGHFAAPEMDATMRMLPSLLSQYGIEQVQTQLHKLMYRVGTVLSNLPKYGQARSSIEFPLQPGLPGVPGLTLCPWASIPEELPVFHVPVTVPGQPDSRQRFCRGLPRFRMQQSHTYTPVQQEAFPL